MNKSPDAFRTIGEVAHWLETPAHVLRFWESRFPEIAPVKRAGGRRYYRPEDMRLLGGIKHLLHDEGKTIKAVQDQLNTQGVAAISALSGELLADKPKSEPAENAPQDSPERTEDAPTPPAEATTEVPPEPAVALNTPSDTTEVAEAAEAAIVPEVSSPPEPTLQPTEAVEEIPTPESTEPEHPVAESSGVDTQVSEDPEDLDDLTASPLFSPPRPSAKPTPPEKATDETPAPLSPPPPSAKGFFFDDSDASDAALEETSASKRPAIYLEDEDAPEPTIEIPIIPAIANIPDDPQDDAQLTSKVLSVAAEIRGLDPQDYRAEPQQELLRVAVRRLSTALGEEI